MSLKKIWAGILALATAASMSACGNDKTAENTDSSAESTTQASENTTTSVTTEKDTEETTAPETDDSSVASVMVYYGWGSSEDEEKYTSEIYCPKGAEFDENTLQNQEENGSVMMVQLSDEVNGYSATSCTHWHRDAYNNEPTNYPIIAQLYFDGELDAETAAENSNCSQKVTPLGFKWNGYDVVMIETTYTFKDYGEKTDLFVGVEYDLDYWKNEEGTGEVQYLTTKALFGFEMYSYGLDNLTQEQCAWIIGELFGVDSGVANPFADESEETAEAALNVAESELVGKWVDTESDWEDTYIFNADGSGVLISGPEYEFTYKVDGNTLSLVYDVDDTESYTVKVNGDTLVLIDKYQSEQSFKKSADETEEPAESETEASTNAESSNPNAAAVIGTWKESETGIDETFTFKADGTGSYSCLTEDGTYKCDFTYEFLRSDYIDIYFDDGDVGGFQIVIDDDKMTVRNEYAWDLVYTRQ
ncbi:MAG: hypothetical protein E7505_05700 [Ruminococcus sp.]|nr:hypothetical protein [Ruminococcus sp.]